MYTIFTIQFPNKRNNLSFGQAITHEELVAVFRLRYKVYTERGYSPKELFPDGLEKDEWDADKNTQYFIAKFGEKIVGVARLIRAKVLPTEREYFSFEEPAEIKRINRDARAELGRLIVPFDRNNKFPRHLITLGLFYALIKRNQELSIKGGYVAVKSKLKAKLTRILFPLHYIPDAKIVYNGRHLEGYFASTEDVPVPAFFITHEVEKFLQSIFENKMLFIPVNPSIILLKRWHILRLTLIGLKNKLVK